MVQDNFTDHSLVSSDNSCKHEGTSALEISILQENVDTILAVNDKMN